MATNGERHLRPVSGREATAADERPEPPEHEEPAGLTPPTRRGGTARFITDVIVDLGFTTAERAEAAVVAARTAGRTPEELLHEQGAISADQLARAVAERYGVDHVDLGAYHVDMGAANLLTASAARRYRAVPVGYVDENTLLVAMADPANVLALDDVQMMTGLKCRAAVAAAEDIDAMIAKLSTLESSITEAIVEEEQEAEDEAAITELRESADDAPVIKLVFSILGQAINEGASDIHFEPEEAQMRVRFRIDGVLQEAAHVPRRMIAGVVSRIKIMSELDIAEKRIPQDGRVSVTVEGREVDLRVTTLPTQRGEGASLRILDKSTAMLTLDDLGLGGDARERFEGSIRRPHGAVLVTGPTGAGKSTTLYAAISAVSSIEQNIVTVEDPVEYQLDGITQIQVNRRAGLDFARGLRSILRADPDIIMVGEIRDAETARIAIEAALTGHMVLSTLHTNTAPGAVTRLREMGIENFLTGSALECVVAQRLARTLCDGCKRRVVIPAQALREAGFRVGGDLEAYEPVGCARCNASGYRGRLGIYSVMALSPEIKELAVTGAPESEIERVAREQGMRSVREDGLDKVRHGLTSVEEISRVST